MCMHVTKSSLASVTVKGKSETTRELSLVEYNLMKCGYMVLAENFIIKSIFCRYGMLPR